MAENESPFIEEGKETKVPVETEKVDIEALAKKLDEFDVKDPGQLEGKLRNANDFSQMQSERDQFANELHQLRAENQRMRSAPQPAATDIDSMEAGQPIDIESMVTNSVNNALDARDKKVAQHQQHMNNMWLKISKHKKYHLVKDEFEQALRDPAKVMQIQTGQVDPFEMYTDMVMDKYEGVTKETVKAFKQMQGTTGVTPPHIESSARSPAMTKDERTDRDKKIDKLRKDRDKNPMGLQHDDEQDAFIDLALGDML